MSRELEAHQILSRSSEVLSSEVGGDMALMSVSSGRYYALNAIASEIWRKLEQPADFAALTAALTAEYDGDPVQIEKDLRETLQEWLTQHLIVVTP